MDFLNSPSKSYDGILQKFVEPKGKHNSIYKIVWSRNFCLYEKRKNKRCIYDTKYDINERNNREERRTAERANNQLLNARINLDQSRRREQELRTQNNNLNQQNNQLNTQNNFVNKK